MSDDTRRRSLGSAGVVSLATLSSRMLGLWREHIFGRLFGAGLYADAFNIAYRIPNLLRDLFAEGALTSALVPALVDERDKRGDRAAFTLTNIVVTSLILVIGVLSLLGSIFAPQLVDLIAYGFADDPEKRALTIDLTRWMMPFLFLISLATVYRSLLNTLRLYGIPALSPALFNIASIVAGYILYFAGYEAKVAIFGWAIAMLIGALAAVLAQVPSARKRGYRFRPALDFAHSGFRRILMQMTPAVLGLAGVQINIIVNSALASNVPGDVSCLNYAFRLIFLPIGVVGVAVATVSTVNVSAAASRKDLPELRDHLTHALALVGFFLLPATAGLIVLAEPIIRLIYEYGAFDASSTERVAVVLQWYAAGLFFHSAVKVAAPAFYAMHRMWIPLVASMMGVAANIIWALATYKSLGVKGLAFGTALAGFFNYAVLAACLYQVLPSGGRSLLAALAKVCCIALVVGGVAWGTERLLSPLLGDAAGHANLPARLLGVFVPIAATIPPFLLLGKWLRIPEADDCLGFLSRRRWGKNPG